MSNICGITQYECAFCNRRAWFSKDARLTCTMPSCLLCNARKMGEFFTPPKLACRSISGSDRSTCHTVKHGQPSLGSEIHDRLRLAFCTFTLDHNINNLTTVYRSPWPNLVIEGLRPPKFMPAKFSAFLCIVSFPTIVRKQASSCALALYHADPFCLFRTRPESCGQKQVHARTPLTARASQNPFKLTTVL